MKLNAPVKFTETTHEGAPAAQHNAEQALRRSVSSCFLWEREFYEDGVAIADRIIQNAKQCSLGFVSRLAIEARSEFNLRHVPLLLLDCMVRRGGTHVISDTIEQVIQRADELPELLSIYWRDGRKPLPAQLKKGLAKAFPKFNAYQLAKYNRQEKIKLRDVLFLTHPKPRTEAQAEVWKNLVDRTLASPDTWEVGLSGGADKKETFERLLSEGKLGYFALLRNLRNMDDAHVDRELIRSALIARKGGAERVLPFRFVSAMRAAPRWAPELDASLKIGVSQLPKLSGTTIVLVDVSGSMSWGRISQKSDLSRMDAGAALGALFHGERVRIFTFSNATIEVPRWRGLPGIESIIKSQEHSGTQLGKAISFINNIAHDRLVVITDEQSADRVPNPVCRHAYMINIASYKNGVGYGRWTHIDGFSEAVMKFMTEFEKI